MTDDFEMTPELEATLRAALAASDANKDKPFEFVGDADWAVVPQKPVLVVRQKDSLGRRWSYFVELNCSPGLDGVALAKQLAEAANTGGIVPARTERK